MRMNRVLYIKYLQRCLCMMLFVFVGVGSAMANTQTFYYAANAYVSPTGSGKVYVSSTATNSPAYKNPPASTSGNQRTVGYGEVTLYYYAQANDGYIFDHWADSDGQAISTSSSYTAQGLQFRSTSSGSPTTFNYYAVFKAQTGWIQVKSADESKGSVTIDNTENSPEEGHNNVTLTAIPDVANGVMFMGWKKNNTGDYISTNNPYTLTVSDDTKGTYYAYFSEPATKVYIRLKNNKTKRFLSFYGNGNISDHTRDFDTYKNVKDGFIFNGSFKMIDATDAQGNPSTVFLRSGHAQGTGVTIGADFSAHGVAYSSLVGANTSQNNGKYMLTMEGDGSSVRIYTTYKVTVGSGWTAQSQNLPTYLCDEGGDYAVMKTIQGLSEEEQSTAEWTLYSLDETTTAGAFGANAKEKYTKVGEDGKQYYYTTMYTDFPYQLLDGVNAYFLVFNEEFTGITDRVVFTQVEGDKVAANTAVILECPAVQNDIESDIVTNRLLPLTKDYPAETVNPGLNFLKGYISVNGSTVDNKDQFYILSAKQGVLGFYHSRTNMTPNKAYLDVRVSDQNVVEEHAKNVTFCFGLPDEEIEGVTTDIVLSNEIVDEADDAIYDLQGRKVKHPTNGIYIRDGKKYVIK